MENKILWRVVYLVVIVIEVIILPSNRLLSEETTRESFTWYNGGSPRTVYLDYGTAYEQVKSVPSSTVSGRSIGREAKFQAISLKNRLKKNFTTFNAKEFFKRKGIFPAFASSKKGSPNMFLTGDVVLHIDQYMTDQEVYDWARSMNYKIQKVFQGKDKSIWKIKTSSKIETLQLSTQLRDVSFIRSAAPVWWRPVQLK